MTLRKRFQLGIDLDHKHTPMWKKTWPQWPSKMTPETIQKLEMAFANSFTDTEACLYAGIWLSTLYDYCKANPKFSDKKEALKKKPNLKAKQNIIQSMNDWNIQDSKRWLERKSKDEFSTKVENDNTITVKDIVVKEPWEEESEEVKETEEN